MQPQFSKSSPDRDKILRVTPCNSFFGYCSQSNNSIRCALARDGNDGLAMLACSALGRARRLLASVSRLRVVESERICSVGGLTEAELVGFDSGQPNRPK